MPSENLKLTLDQRVRALQWLAINKKLENFLRATPVFPELAPDEVCDLLDVVESALLDLRREFEYPI